MKQIISNKLYNTETATEKGFDCYNGSCSDFQWWEETLYQKRTGEFFLFGQGGPMSQYAESCGLNSWGGGSQIIPLSEGEAKTWAEKHLTADEYIIIFGDVEE